MAHSRSSLDEDESSEQRRLAVAQPIPACVDRQNERGPRVPGRGSGGKGRRGQAPAEPRGQQVEGDGGEFRTEVPAHAFDLILGRPTHSTITLSVLAYEDIEGYVAYGTEQGRLGKTTPPQKFQSGQPVEIVIDSLQPNTALLLRIPLAPRRGGSVRRQRRVHFPHAAAAGQQIHLHDHGRFASG